MNALKHFFENKKHLFEKGGKLESLYPAYEAADTFLFTPDSVTQSDAHVRDSLDLKRTMMMVVYALIPTVLFGLYNTGFQAHTIIASGKFQAIGWRHDLFLALGFAHDPNSILANFVYGALFFIPVWLVCNIVGGICEMVFASIRKHEVNEGFLVTGWLIPLVMPLHSLWQLLSGLPLV